jgi:hypothetical protein
VVRSMTDQEIFSDLTIGVDEASWKSRAVALRGRNYSIFEIAQSDRVEFEIISPDCVTTWRLSSGCDGQFRLL